MNTRPEFISFRKIPRWFREIKILEKIDGSNGQIYVPEDSNEPLLAGSRNKWITIEHDNYGFAAWVQSNSEELRTLGPGRHFGEWYGSKIQRGYGMVERRFVLFDTDKWSERRPSCCDVVPILSFGPNTEEHIFRCLEHLKSNGSALVSGFMRPEGVVVIHNASGHKFKILLEGDEHPKGNAE